MNPAGGGVPAAAPLLVSLVAASGAAGRLGFVGLVGWRRVDSGWQPNLHHRCRQMMPP